MPRNMPSDDVPTVDPAWMAAWETENNYWFENFTSRKLK
jgi:hypothetical protein